MARDLPCYSVADKGALAALRDSLRAAVGVRPARVHALSRTYYDTPDWRLYRAGRAGAHRAARRVQPGPASAGKRPDARDPGHRGATGRADLLRALAVADRDHLALDRDASSWFGYVRQASAWAPYW